MVSIQKAAEPRQALQVGWFDDKSEVLFRVDGLPEYKKTKFKEDQLMVPVQQVDPKPKTLRDGQFTLWPNIHVRNIFVEAYGTDGDRWNGKYIMLEAGVTMYKGNEVKSIRVNKDWLVSKNLLSPEDMDLD